MTLGLFDPLKNSLARCAREFLRYTNCILLPLRLWLEHKNKVNHYLELLGIRF
jgi:hypothetical protein